MLNYKRKSLSFDISFGKMHRVFQRLYKLYGHACLSWKTVLLDDAVSQFVRVKNKTILHFNFIAAYLIRIALSKFTR